jgi:hypothetical protein
MSDQLYDAYDDACNRVREQDAEIAALKARIALLEAEVKEARKQGLEDGYMRANIENVGAYTLLKEENQRLRRALQHVQFYALDNVPDELREMAKALLQEDKP